MSEDDDVGIYVKVGQEGRVSIPQAYRNVNDIQVGDIIILKMIVNKSGEKRIAESQSVDKWNESVDQRIQKVQKDEEQEQETEDHLQKLRKEKTRKWDLLTGRKD